LPGHTKKYAKANSANDAKNRKVLLQYSKANIKTPALRFPYSESKGYGTFHTAFWTAARNWSCPTAATKNCVMKKQLWEKV